MQIIVKVLGEGWTSPEDKSILVQSAAPLDIIIYSGRNPLMATMMFSHHCDCAGQSELIWSIPEALRGEEGGKQRFYIPGLLQRLWWYSGTRGWGGCLVLFHLLHIFRKR